MPSLLPWHWVLVAVGIALVTCSVIGTFWWYHRRRRRWNKEKDPGETKQAAAAAAAAPVVVEESRFPGSVSDVRLDPTPTTTASSDTNSITVVDMDKLDHQLVLMPLSPRRQQKIIKLSVDGSNSSSSGGNGDENKYRALVQQQADDESSHRRISLSPFLAGVDSPQPPPSRPDTNSSCSTAQSMLPKAVLSSCLNQTWRGPTPPWTMPVE